MTTIGPAWNGFHPYTFQDGDDRPDHLDALIDASLGAVRIPPMPRVEVEALLANSQTVLASKEMFAARAAGLDRLRAALTQPDPTTRLSEGTGDEGREDRFVERFFGLWEEEPPEEVRAAWERDLRRAFRLSAVPLPHEVIDALPQAEREEYERKQQSIVDARRAAPANEGRNVVSTTQNPQDEGGDDA